MLSGLADISEAAWRKRLRRSSAWLQWILGELLAFPGELKRGMPGGGRVLLVDASRLRQPGGTGDDWRLPWADDLRGGRMSQVQITDQHGGERLDRYRGQAGDVVVADNGYGYRRSVAWAAEHDADVVLRIHPATCPLETENGQPFNVWRWLRRRGPAHREWTGWCQWQGQRYRVRLVAGKLDAQATRRARHRCRRKAQQAGHPVHAPTLALAGWVVLLTTLAAATWPVAEVLALYRARWQVELVFKKMKQLLRLNQLRSTQRDSVEATVRSLLVAWALHEDTTTLLRTLLHTAASPTQTVVSSWLLSGLSLETLRQQVFGSWSEARLQECVPRLARFLCCPPRRRLHQESTVRAWLEQRAQTLPEPLPLAA